nr:hypothetical protein [Candidatus Levybacteria bacterium]
MPNQELISYIKNALAQGSTRIQINTALLESGWQQNDIDLAFASLNNPANLIPPQPLPKHMANSDSDTSMWDSFEHILLFISLYVMATSIGLLLNYFVDRWFSPLGSTGSYSSYANSFSSVLVNGYLAALIVSMPLFSVLFILIQKRTISNPAIKNLKARKQLIYFTLIITFIIMLFNVVTTVYSLLNGNLSLNFIMHFLVNVGISGFIFIYYLLQVIGDKKI